MRTTSFAISVFKFIVWFVSFQMQCIMHSDTHSHCMLAHQALKTMIISFWVITAMNVIPVHVIMLCFKLSAQAAQHAWPSDRELFDYLVELVGVQRNTRALNASINWGGGRISISSYPRTKLDQNLHDCQHWTAKWTTDWSGYTLTVIWWSAAHAILELLNWKFMYQMKSLYIYIYILCKLKGMLAWYMAFAT